MSVKMCFVINLLILMLVSSQVQSYLSNIESASQRLDELLVGTETQRYSRDLEKDIDIWQEYEFGTGVGNREELWITNITSKVDPRLSESTYNYQYVDKNGEHFLAGSSDHLFSLYKLDLAEDRVTYATQVYSEKKILTFKLLNLPNSCQSENEKDSLILAILSVESDHGTDLLWYRFDGKHLVYFWSWPVQKGVESLQFFHHANQNRLLILREAISYFGQLYSPIDIYGFSIIGERPSLWVTQRMTVPKTFHLQVCQTYESTIMVLQCLNDVVIYEYTGDMNKEGLFEDPRNVTSKGIRNTVCFESGYIRYLITSGPEATLFDYFENEFQRDSDSEYLLKEIGKVSWIQSLPVDTYREEAILLVQLENTTIIVLSWKGRGFEKISLPGLEFTNMDLSRVTIISRYGFVYGNILIRFDTKLREKPRPARDEMEKMMQMKQALAELLRKQESILDETELRINDSYFVNPNVTGFWNLTEVEADSVIIEDEVSIEKIMIGTKNIQLNELLSDLNTTNAVLRDLETKLLEIRSNVAKSVLINSSEVILTGDLIIDGGFDVRNTMSVKNLTIKSLNGFTLDNIYEDLYDYDDKTLVIKGLKTFESIDTNNLNVMFINGVPVSDFVFDTKKRDYSNVDFSKLLKLEVEGNLNFSTINNIDWKELMRKVVLKSKTLRIPGITKVEGDLIANSINIARLNGLRYPEDYILTNSADTAMLTGEKEFSKLKVGNLDLDDLKTINGVPIEEYVTLHGDRILNEEITFENLIVTETLQVDGKVTGLPDTATRVGRTMNETSTIATDIVVFNLKVIGDMEVEHSLNGTTWSELDDIISKEDDFVEITGHKTFLSEVEVDSELVIENQRINGHAIDEFVTLDTEQVFSNLERISGNVTFDQVTRGDLEALKKYLTKDLDDNGQPTCLTKLIVFKVPPIVDKVFLQTVNRNVSANEFSNALKKTFSNVRFHNLEVLTLRAREILPVTLNGKNFQQLMSKRISKKKSQTLTGNYEIGTLETKFLHVGTIDGMPVKELEVLRNQLDDFYDGIVNGSVAIDTLTVNSPISTSNINGIPLQSIYDPDTMGTVIFPKDVHIENLHVNGLINRVDFNEYAEDAVSKTDRNIVVTGKKTFDKIICEALEAKSLNGKSVDSILDPAKHQVITGSLKVNGTVTVLDHFETSGKIGGVSWQDIRERFRYLGNNTYSLTGDLRFTSEEVEIVNLFVTNSIQGVPFNNFLDTVIYKNSTNVTIYSPVVFKDTVTINSPFVITESFNDLDLKYFYDHAVRIDQPFSVKSKVVFTEDIVVEKDLIVQNQLEAKSVGGVNLKELYDSATFVDRPMYFSGTTILENVIFESDIEVEILNNIDMRKVMTLAGDQVFDSTLHCMDITVGKLDIGGTFNGQDLGAIYDDTFMLTGHQNITGHIVFRGNVYMRRDFDARLINGIDPKTMIALNGNETMNSNFVFEKPIILHGKHKAFDTVNDIDLMTWEATGVTKNFPLRQIIKGSWRIHGNVYFKGNVDGSDFLDGVNVTSLVDDLHRSEVENELVMTDVKNDLHSICEDLSILKHAAENQVYRYKYFEYLQVLNFDRFIVSVHQFESDDFDYLLVNYDTCDLDVLVFTGSEFSAVTSISNVGYVERWFTMHIEGEIYFLTVGKYACNRNTGNLWKLSNYEFVHVEDLGNVTDARKMSDGEFLVVVDGLLVRRKMVEIYQRSLSRPKSYQTGSDGVKFVQDSYEVLLADKHSIYKYQLENETGKQMVNFFGTNELASFRLGIYEKEVFVYHDDNVSEEYIFISDNNFENHKILQTIKARRPSFITVINFDGLVENFLIFIENRLSLQIYEYRGIEGFVYRETIKMSVEKIFKLKLRRYSKLSKKHCIAAIQGKTLVILEAKMYGERLDMGSLHCEN